MSTKSWRMRKKSLMRQIQAELRQKGIESLTTEERLEVVTSRPGSSKKEVAKLNAKREK